MREWGEMKRNSSVRGEMCTILTSIKNCSRQDRHAELVNYPFNKISDSLYHKSLKRNDFLIKACFLQLFDCMHIKIFFSQANLQIDKTWFYLILKRDFFCLKKGKGEQASQLASLWKGDNVPFFLVFRKCLPCLSLHLPVEKLLYSRVPDINSPSICESLTSTTNEDCWVRSWSICQGITSDNGCINYRENKKTLRNMCLISTSTSLCSENLTWINQYIECWDYCCCCCCSCSYVRFLLHPRVIFVWLWDLDLLTVLFVDGKYLVYVTCNCLYMKQSRIR